MVLNLKHCSTLRSDAALTSTIRTVTGSHRFKIVPFSYIKLLRYEKFISSATFTVDDYDWIIRYYPNGGYSYGQMMLALELRSPCKIENVAFEFFFYDKIGNPVDETRQKNLDIFDGFRSFRISRGMRDSKLGGSHHGQELHHSVSVSDIQSFLKDDCLTIGCNISILKPSHLTRSVVVPPSNILQDFRYLLESEEGSDVTFEVNGQTFNAHRCVLSARSPVFKAELFGHMKESTSGKIKVMEIQAPVFKAMLHFIYTDSLPEVGEDSIVMTQHLLEAADRYDLERLKIICEELLSKNIEESNVFSILALAELHNCSQLVDACIEFIGTSKKFRDVIVLKKESERYYDCNAIDNID